MNELMNAQKPPCRAPADEKRRRACHSFPRCGLQYKQLFSCFVCMLCLPLILPHFSFRSCCPGIHFSSCAAYIWEVILWFILISLGFTCNSHLLCFQILTPFLKISTWVLFLTFLELFFTILFQLPPTIVTITTHIICV